MCTSSSLQGISRKVGEFSRELGASDAEDLRALALSSAEQVCATA
jgi:hypothetical protein